MAASLNVHIRPVGVPARLMATSLVLCVSTVTMRYSSECKMIVVYVSDIDDVQKVMPGFITVSGSFLNDHSRST